MPRLENIDVLLLDMNGTFMFGHDRLENVDEIARVAREHVELADHGVPDLASLLSRILDRLSRCYTDPEFYERFPSIEQCAVEIAPTLSRGARVRIADVIAAHECGVVPGEYAAALGRLAERYTLGLVSNIWAPRARWVEQFRRAGIEQLFRTLVWSSDCGIIKPSPRIYARALDELGVAASRVAFIGDDPLLDVDGPRAVGLFTVGVGTRDGIGRADLHFENLLEFADSSLSGGRAARFPQQ